MQLSKVAICFMGMLPLMVGSHFVWGPDPVLFSVGRFSVRWYGVFFASAFVFGFWVIGRIYRIESKPVQDLDSLLWYMVIGTVVGARLGHCLFYEPYYYLSNPFRILMVWRGGLASHGAAIGILLSLYVYSRSRPQQGYLWLLDRMSLVVASGGGFIRIGNFFNSEIIGRPTGSSSGVVFSLVDQIPRHPTQLYESVAYFCVFIALGAIYNRYRAETPRLLLFGLFLISVFGFRLFVEQFKEPQVEFEVGLLLNMGQMLSIPLIILGLFCVAKVGKERLWTKASNVQ